ncbi:ion transporter [Verrucomicrobiales bacterium]|nr:ion transporter [Verrucomicrobiales bacterium]
MRSGSYPSLIALVESKSFTRIVILFILAAAALVGLETSESIMSKYGSLIHVLDALVLYVFAAEALLKILSHLPKPGNYFKDGWNVFDFSIVVICFMPFDAEYVAVLRLARVLRVLRLLSVVPKLQILVVALLRSIPSMFYVTILLFILFYIYAVLGVMLFGDNDPKHYADLGDSMLSLFRVVTLEDWTDIMYINMYGSDNYGYELSEMSRYPGIVPTASPLASVIFHVSFVLFGTMVMLNLFIGVIMTGMQEAQEETLQLNEKDGTTKSKLGDYSAIVEEMRELEDQVETLRNRLRGVREREEKRK